jgi:hypothetical protein
MNEISIVRPIRIRYARSLDVQVVHGHPAYVYAQEAERRRYDIVFAGLAFWLADWINEIANSLVLHFTDRAALWTVTGDTSSGAPAPRA